MLEIANNTVVSQSLFMISEKWKVNREYSQT